MQKNKVAIVGLGYVGLPLALKVSENKDYEVVGFDVDVEKVKGLVGKYNSLSVSGVPGIIDGSEYILICVPTPVKSNNRPDFGPLKNACKTVAAQLEKGQNVVIESTINPGVCEEVLLPILEQTGLRGGVDFNLAHCPERINPGDGRWHVGNIPRNVGALTVSHAKKTADFYRSFLDDTVTELSSIKVAEATKVVENAFRDINIAYVNELAMSFDAMGIDLIEVLKGASTKPFAFMAHYPGCGVGGHCIPVDPYYLISRAKKSGFNHSFLKKAREVNNYMPEYTVKLLIEKLKSLKILPGKVRVGLLGLAYKADVGDMRESPALKIKKLLQDRSMQVFTYDPCLPLESDKKSLSDLLKAVDVVVLATAHKEFDVVGPVILKKHGIKLVIDGKNFLDKNAIEMAGILYKGIGH